MSRKRVSALPRMTDEELRAFVFDYVDGLIFTSDMIKPLTAYLVGMVFMPFALGAADTYTAKAKADIGQIYEYYTAKRVPGRAINGYPIFLSARIMSRTDWARAVAAIARLQAERAQQKTNFEL